MSRNERNFAEALQPRPVAIEVGDHIIAIDKIISWNWDRGSIFIAVAGNYFDKPDPARKVADKLGDLFRVVTP